MESLEKALIVILEVVRLIVRVIPFWPGDKSREEQLFEIDELITELEQRIENATDEYDTQESENV
jgi:cell division protein FtsL